MKINQINNYNQSFKAHYYKVQPNRPIALEIQTDKNPNLGNDPHLVTPELPEGYRDYMIEVGDKYCSLIPARNALVKYFIEYDDTEKKDDNEGKGYSVDKKMLLEKANVFLRNEYNQPLIHTINSGSASGKLIIIDNDSFDEYKDIDEPCIILTDTMPEIPDNPNILGILTTLDDTSLFSHFATQLRNAFEISGCIYDPKIISCLKNFEGQNIKISLKDNFISFRKTDTTEKPITYPTANIPKLKYCNRILTSKEYSPDLIGAKAVNLGKLEKLKEQGKIDVIIPKSIALPFGFIDEFLNCDGWEYRTYKEEKHCEKVEALKEIIEKEGITNPEIMVRSSFNGEDLAEYSAAGLYTSEKVNKNPNNRYNQSLYGAIQRVKSSKDSISAIKSRARYKISESDIKAGIIIQNKINEDYKFTLYTDDNNGNIKIDMFSNPKENPESKTKPHTFTYNKTTGELIYNSIQMGNATATFDEDFNIIEYTPSDENLLRSKELFKQIKRLCENVMVIEKEFASPQDIEGGIKDDNVYIWQTRNIVNNI